MAGPLRQIRQPQRAVHFQWFAHVLRLKRAMIDVERQIQLAALYQKRNRIGVKAARRFVAFLGAWQVVGGQTERQKRLFALALLVVELAALIRFRASFRWELAADQELIKPPQTLFRRRRLFVYPALSLISRPSREA